ncbi:MAG: carbon-nitrogen hydrolase family protein [Thermodesulfobacteriota bacterium]|nr:carbon-nitrogen hydrolase family protein [Thermodesulfobacteriota bacterium]
MKVAAIQMTADPGAVEKNLQSAQRLAKQAFQQGAKLVILPEFFPSAMGFHPCIEKAVRPFDGKPARLLKDLARTHDGIIGGSFIAARQTDIFNTFILAFPDGTIYTHDKDMPTMWENCYYQGGSDNGILTTPLGNIGVALCWEFVRTQTVRRLLNRVNFVVGGSCWWGLPDQWLPGFNQNVAAANIAIMKDTPSRFARLLGRPVVHAAHAGAFKCNTPLLPGFPYRSFFLGETQIVDARGNILAKMARSDGEGIIMADIDTDNQCPPAEPISEKFWIPDLPLAIRFAWWYQNLHGKWYYARHHKKNQ